MTLGEKITSLRNTHKMSQGDLAEKLNVSRQSVSKWETGASVPELTKLIMMSDLFHISLDELVKSDFLTDDVPIESQESKTTYIVNEKHTSSKHIIGFILLGVGLLSGILGFIFSPVLLMLCLCLIIYSVICLVAKKYTGIICGWFSVLLIAVPVYISGARLSNIGFGFNIATIMSFLFWILATVMAVITIRVIRRNRKK